MGTVYRATDRLTGEPVALKLLHAGPSEGEEAERFAREAQLLASLDHPGIVAHVAHGQTPEGQRFLAMEWLDGQDLNQRLLRGPLSVRDSVLLLSRIADALGVAHRRGIVHRDLKPSNLFLVGNAVARVKILDFGIARRGRSSLAMTRTGVVIGTPEYMAPEQARGQREITPAADLFSLGCVLYECLTGQPPFVAEHVAAVLARILFEEPQPLSERLPGIPVEVAQLVEQLLAKLPAERMADADALHSYLAGLGSLPEPALAATMIGAARPSERFAEHEQNLLSIVLASPPSTDLLGATLPREVAQLSLVQRESLLQLLIQLGGHPEFLANGTLVVTVSPLSSAQDQAALAARIALVVKDRWPDAAVSMATGRGSVRGRSAVGEVVELAARALSSDARSEGRQGSGVLIDTLSAKLLMGRFVQTITPSGAILLHEERKDDTGRPLLGKPTPCVGRDAELSVIESQLTACIEESAPRVLLFLAPPGMGKSRLRHEFLRRVEGRSEAVTVLQGRGEMVSAGTPYGILRSALRRLMGIAPVDDDSPGAQLQLVRERVRLHVAAAEADRVATFLAELCGVSYADSGSPLLQAARQDPKIMRDRLRRALLDFIAAECSAGPLLLVLDDLQWGDSLSIAVLDEALRERADAPLCVVAFARPELEDVFPRLWHEHNTQSLALKGLSKKACERLIAHVLGRALPAAAVARAIEQAGGNALYLEEHIRLLADGRSDEKPDTVLAMLQARIGRLDAEARRLVRAAAIFGMQFSTGGVATIVDVRPDSEALQTKLAVLCDAELIQRQPGIAPRGEQGYVFRHALVRDAAYDLLTEQDCVTGHRRAAEFLERTTTQESATIAAHFERSGDPLRAAQAHCRAAEEGLWRGDVMGSLRHIEQGLTSLPQGELLGRLRGMQAYVLMLCDRHEQLAELTDVALAVLRPGELTWCRAIGPAVMDALNRQDAGRLQALLSRMLPAEPDPAARATYADALTTAFVVCTVAAPLPLLALILQRVEGVVAQAVADDATMRRYVHICRAWLAHNRTPTPWTLLEEAQAAIAACDQAGDLLWGDWMRFATLEAGWLELGDVDGARRRLAALTAQLERCEHVNTVQIWRYLLASALCMSNDPLHWTQAEALANQMVAFVGGFALYPLLGQGLLARLSLLRGAVQDAERKASAVMQLFAVAPVWLARVAPTYLEALMALGRADEAAAIATQMLAALETLGGFGVGEVQFRLTASEALRSAGQYLRAQQELQGTLRLIQSAADDIRAPEWRERYLEQNPYVIRAREQAQLHGVPPNQNDPAT